MITRTLTTGVVVLAGILASPATFQAIGLTQDSASPGAAASSSAFCSSTADSLLRACGFEAQDDYWKAVAKCTNVSDSTERAECLAEAKTDRADKNKLCRSQFDGRVAACGLLGEDRYDPAFKPDSFEKDFAHLANPNRYFPLTIGYWWEFRGGDEVNTVEVLNRTKLIVGVTCVVIRDLVKIDGRVHEGTDDWYAQAKDRNVWYCGEEVKNYEVFDGDKPKLSELVSIDGSFKAGRDRDKPGVIFLASPGKGDVYLEEFSLGNAEDVTEILSATYKFGADPELDRFVPRALADTFCSGDCVVTKNYSLLEPGVVQRKYYAPDIGVFLEVDPASGETSQLTNCNFDGRCATLPTP